MQVRHILCATDFSECSARALDAAMDLAERFGAQLSLIHVCEIPAYAYAGAMAAPVDLATPVTESGREHLTAVLAETRKRLPATKAVLKNGIAWEQVVAAASDLDADLVVVGTNGRTGVRHALIGSVAERVVRHSPVPVLTVCGPK